MVCSKVRLSGSASKFSYSKLILILYSVYTFISILDATLLEIDFLMKSLKFVTVLIQIMILCAIFFKYRFSYKHTMMCVFTVVVFFLVANVTQRYYLIIFALFIVQGQFCDFEDVVKVSFFTSITALLTVLFLCGVGIIDNHIYSYDNSQRSGYCLGFSYYSMFPYIFYYCSLMYLYLRKYSVRFIEYAIILAMNYFLYRLTSLRLTFYLIWFSVILDFIFCKFKNIDLNTKVVRIVSRLLFPITLILVFVAARCYSGQGFMLKLNKALSGRLSLSNEALSIYPVNLFGNYIEMRGNSAIHETIDYFYVDSGFVYALLGYGLIFTIFIIFLYSSVCVCSCKNNNKFLFVWVASVLLFTISNNVWLNITYNPILMVSLVTVCQLKGERNLYRQKCTSFGTLHTPIIPKGSYC